MEHAIRHHIRKNLDQDPVHYTKLSERLEAILRQFGENWEQLALALKDFVEEVEAGRQEAPAGLDPQTQGPFLAVLKEEREKQGPVSDSDLAWLAGLTIQLVDRIRTQTSVVGFWANPHAQRGSPRRDLHVLGRRRDRSVRGCRRRCRPPYGACEGQPGQAGDSHDARSLSTTFSLSSAEAPSGAPFRSRSTATET